MIGLMRAELLRLRKRRSLQAIVLAVPLLVGVTFVLGYNSIYEQPPFDEAAFRQELLDGGYGVGVPPEELEPILAEAIESQRQMMAQVEESQRLVRATYVFPYSLVQVLGSGTPLEGVDLVGLIRPQFVLGRVGVGGCTFLVLCHPG